MKFDVMAVLSATDRGFKSAMRSAQASVSGLKSAVSGGIGFGLLAGAGQAAFNAVSGSVMGLGKEVIGTSDSMAKLQKAMRFSGTAESEIQRIAGLTGTLKTYADKTVFDLNDVMGTFGALTANGISDSDKMTEALGNAVAVYSGGKREFSAVGLAFSQAMAAGALHAQDWNQILNASPQLAGGLRKELQRLNPALGEDFKGAMEKGQISAELLGQAVNNIGMTDFAKEAAQSVTTFDGAMGNLQAAVTSGMLKLYDSFAKSGVVSVINRLTDKVTQGFEYMADKLPVLIGKIKPYWDAFVGTVIRVKDAFAPAVSAIVDKVKELMGGFGTTESVDKFKEAMNKVAQAVEKVAGFVEKHSGAIATLITNLPKIWLAMKGFQIVKPLVPFVASFGGALARMAGKGISGLAGKLFGISKGQGAVGKASVESSGPMLASAKAFLMFGAGILMISGGFYLLAQGAVAVATAGPAAIAVLFGLIGAIALLGFGMTVMVSTLAPFAPVLGAISLAFLALGGAVLLISAGFAILAATAIQLTSAGWPAVAVMFGLIGAVALLAIGAAILGPALTAGAVGFLAFGAAMLMIGAALAIATPAIEALPPVIEAVGTAFATVAEAIGNAVAIILDGVSQVIDSIGNALRNVLDGIAGIFDSIGGAALNAGRGFKLAAEGLKMIAGIGIVGLVKSLGALGKGIRELTKHSEELQQVGQGMQQLATSMSILQVGVMAFTMLGTAIMTTGTAMQTMSGSFTAFTASITGLGAVVVTVAAPFTTVAMASRQLSTALIGSVSGVQAFAMGVTLMASVLASSATAVTALTGGISSFGSTAAAQLGNVSGGAKRAQGALIALTGAMSTVSAGLAALSAMGQKSMSALLRAFIQTAAGAVSAGQKVGRGFAQGMTPGLASAVSQAGTAANGIVSRLSAAASGAYSSGVYIGQGLANGMRSMLGTVWAVAAQLAAAADRAIVAKAKIGSPSRVAIRNGAWIGEGLGIGIKDMIGYVGRMGARLVDAIGLNDLPQPQLAFAGGIDIDIPDIPDMPTPNRTLNSDWSYGRGGQYTIEVPLSVDGREIARAEAPYTEAELARREKLRRNRLGER